MTKLTRAVLSLTIAFQLPVKVFANPAISSEQMKHAAEVARAKAQQDLAQISNSLLKYEYALAEIRAEIGKSEESNGKTLKRFKIGTTVLSSVLIAGGVLMMMRPQVSSQGAGFGHASSGAMFALANSLVTIYGTGDIKDWKTSDIRKAKEQNARLQSLIEDSLANDDLDQDTKLQLMTLQGLSRDLNDVLKKEDQTTVDKTDKALAALQVVAFIWGFMGRNNIGAVQIGKNYFAWSTIQTAIMISFGALKTLTGQYLILNPQDLKAVGQSLDMTIENIEKSRMKLEWRLEKLNRE